MECIQTQISHDNMIYGLFLEENPDGTAHSVINHYDALTGDQRGKILEVDEWISSIWLSNDDNLYIIDFEGKILKYDGEFIEYTTVDLLGTVHINGFGNAPEFILGEGGIFYYYSDGRWNEYKLGDERVTYAVEKIGDSKFIICGEEGLLVEFDGSYLQNLDTPTTIDLHGIAKNGSGEIVTVGDLGTGYIYQDGAIREFFVDVESLQDVACFRTNMIVSAEAAGAYVLDTATSEISQIYNGVCYTFSQNDTHLVTHGGGAFHVYDGEMWQRLQYQAP